MAAEQIAKQVEGSFYAYTYTDKFFISGWNPGNLTIYDYAAKKSYSGFIMHVLVDVDASGKPLGTGVVFSQGDVSSYDDQMHFLGMVQASGKATFTKTPDGRFMATVEVSGGPLGVQGPLMFPTDSAEVGAASGAVTLSV